MYRDNAVKRVKSAAKYTLVLLGAATLAFGLYNVHAQSDITEGGVLGSVLLIQHWFGISPAISGALLDIICYLVAFKLFGKRFAKFSLVATAGFSVFYAVFERFDPLLPSFAAHPLWAAILGGVFVGAGCGMIVQAGGAAGGDDALAMSIAKVSGWSLTWAYLFTDAIVLLLSLTYIPAGKVLYSVVTVLISSVLIGQIQKLSIRLQTRQEAALAEVKTKVS